MSFIGYRIVQRKCFSLPYKYDNLKHLRQKLTIYKSKIKNYIKVIINIKLIKKKNLI